MQRMSTKLRYVEVMKKTYSGQHGESTPGLAMLLNTEEVEASAFPLAYAQNLELFFGSIFLKFLCYEPAVRRRKNGPFI